MIKPIVLVVLVLVIAAVQCKPKCVVVAPRSIRSNSEYRMSIATHGATQPIQFRVKIYEREESSTNKTMDYKPNQKNTRSDPVDCGSKRGPKLKLMTKSIEDTYSTDVKASITGSKTRTITVNPNASRIVKFKYDKDVLAGSYVLEVQSLNVSSPESSFYEKQFLFVETETLSIFIQTNKASYRPGDVCKYRVVVVDTDLRPVVSDSSLTISIYDVSKNMVHQLSNQSTKKGVYSGQYQLPARGKHDVWEIQAEYKSKKVRKQIELTKSTKHPNFQVIAKIPSFISNNSTMFSIGGECFYTFGKPVLGKAFIKATPILKSMNSWSETAKPVTMTKDVRGTFAVTFQMASFKIPRMRTCESILIETSVREKATGIVMRGHDKTITVDYKNVRSKYDIALHYFGFFLAGQMYSVKVHVRTKNGSPLPTNVDSVKFAIAFDSKLTDASKATAYDLDASGKAEILVPIPDKVTSKLHFKVTYSQVSEEVTVLSKKLHVQVINTNSYKLNKKIQFQVGSQEKLISLSYYVVGRGNVLVSESVNMNNTNMAVFEFDYTLSMGPSCTLVVYYVTEGGQIVSDETNVDFAQDMLTNAITVSVSDTKLKPNQEVTISLTTDPDSLLAMSCVDQSVLLENQGNSLSRNKVYNELRLYDNAGDMDLDKSFTDDYINLLKPGTLALTNAMKFKDGTTESFNITSVRRNVNYDYTSDTKANIIIPLQPVCSFFSMTTQEQQALQNTTWIRRKFDDTLLWQDLDYTNGVATIKTLVPETVTSWILTGYSMSSTNGLGFLPNPLVLSTFKPFFVDLKLPGSIRMGDLVEVQVIIHNYMDQTSRVEVTLDDSGDGFDLVPTGRQLSDYEVYNEDYEQRNLNQNTVQNLAGGLNTTGRQLNDYEAYNEDYELRNLNQNTLQVLADGVKVTSFTVRPKKIGPMRVKVQAISAISCDTLEKVVMVEPQGQTFLKTETRPILLSPFNTSVDTVFEVNVPANAVPGSVRIQLAVQGDKYTLDLENPPPPSTMGEDVLATQLETLVNSYLRAAGSGSICAWSEIETKSSNFANIMVKYQCPDGGFRIDGDCDMPTRDATYTAQYAAKTALGILYNYTRLQPIINSLNWLVTVQRPDGSFPNPNPYPNEVYVEGPIATSFILLSIATCIDVIPAIRVQYNDMVNRSMNHLFDQVDSLDILSLAFLGQAAQLQKDARKRVVLDKIVQLSMKNEISQRWSLNSTALVDEAVPQILTIFMNEPDFIATLRTANGMVKYLVENQNRIGQSARSEMFLSLSSFYGRYSKTNTQLTVTSSTSPTTSRSTTVIDVSNKALLTTYDIDSNTKMVRVMAIGTGFANLEVTYEYNLKNEDVVDAYLLELNLTSVIFKEWQLNICISLKQTAYPASSVMKIQFPPGFSTTEFVQDHDPMTTKIVRKELKGDGMVVHLENLDSQPVCFVVPLYRVTFVEQPLVGTVVVHDENYYRSEKPHCSRAEFNLPSYDFTETVDAV